MVKKITHELISNLSRQAQAIERKRKNHNFHEDLNDSLQRMLNAIEPETYVQPHKHEDPDKREIFIVLSGRTAILFFDDSGKVTDHIILDQTMGNYGIEIPAKTWHSVIALKKNTVVFEVKDGPYQAISDKNFASWAPKEGEPGCDNYLNQLKTELNLE